MGRPDDDALPRTEPHGEARLVVLDGVRGLAVAAVLVFHAWGFWPAESRSVVDRAVAAIAGELWIGVDLFFVLSGFLITRILLASRGRPGYFKRFYARRTLRIFPLYYATIFAFCVVGGLTIHTPRFRALWEAQGWLWAYALNFKIFAVGEWFISLDNCWSLAVEEQFYLVWPAVVAALAPRRLVPVAAGVALGSVALRVAMMHRGFTIPQVYVFTPARLDGLMLGGALAGLEHLATSPRVLARLALGGVILGAALRLAVALGWLGSGDPQDPWITTAWTPVFAAVLAWTTLPGAGGFLGRALAGAPLRFLGKYSYGIYLLHDPLFQLAAKPLAHVVVPFSGAATNAVRLAIAGPAVVGVAFASFHLFEKHFLKLKDRFA